MFITFEGPEGAGKSTVLAGVAHELRALGLTVLTTREPGAGTFGTEIRRILLDGEDMPSESELFLFLADRAHHVRRIIFPALSRGEWVLCDRFADSTYVYQSVVRGLDPEFVSRANQFATGGLIPTRTFLLDIAPELGLSRLQSKDRLDSQPVEFHRAVREGFLAMAELDKARWKLIDASRSKDAVKDEILASINELLKSSPENAKK